MKRHVRPVLFLLLAQCVLSIPLYADTPIRVGVYQNEPLVFVNGDGNVRGFYIDVLEAIAAEEGWHIEYVPCAWSECLERLEGGEIDLQVAIAYSADRDERFDFTSETMLSNWGQVYTRKNAGIQSVLDLEGGTVAVLKGDIYSAEFKRITEGFGVNCDFVEVGEYGAVFGLVDRGEVDAGLITRLYGLQHERDYAVDRSPILCCPVELRFAVPEGENQALIDVLDRHLAALKGDQNSVYYRALDEWFGGLSRPGFPQWLKWTLALAGGLLLFFLGGNIALQSQVRARTKELVKYRDHLAELVQERTAGLEAANDQLEREIAGRKLAEATLRESTEKIRAMFESMTDGITFGDLQGNIVDLNEATVRMHEFESKEELIGRSAFELIAESDQARALENLQKTLATGRSGVIEYKLVTKTGREFDGELSAVLLKDEQGNPSAFVALTRDISERKRAEEAQRESEEKYSMLFNEMLTGLSLHEIILDDHGKPVDYRFLDVNPAFEKHTGLKKQDLVGRTVLEVLPGTEPIWIETSGEVALGGEPVHFEHYSSEIGKYYEVVTFCPRKGQFATLSSDITERKKIEQELQEYREHLEELVEERTAELKERVAEVEQLNQAMTNVLEDLQAANLRATETARHLQEANAELESFSYSVSHDLRAPLRHIDGFVGMLAKREGERLDETSTRYLNIVRESVARMGRLIDDLLTLSRTGRAEMRSQHVELGELVEAVRRELASEAQERHITWQIAPLPAVEGDLNLLRQVWVNLISNACKYTAPRREAQIEIGAVQGETGGRDEHSQVTLFIRDNGVGFDQRYAHKLFGVFQRLHQAKEFEGTGVGLAIVRRIIHRHGGQVWAEGEPDRGATFYMTLTRSVQ